MLEIPKPLLLACDFSLVHPVLSVRTSKNAIGVNQKESQQRGYAIEINIIQYLSYCIVYSTSTVLFLLSMTSLSI